MLKTKHSNRSPCAIWHSLPSITHKDRSGRNVKFAKNTPWKIKKQSKVWDLVRFSIEDHVLLNEHSPKSYLNTRIIS